MVGFLAFIQDQFVPSHGATESIPAAPLVFYAYGFAWIVVMTYITSLWRRLARVGREVRALGKDPRATAR